MTAAAMHSPWTMCNAVKTGNPGKKLSNNVGMASTPGLHRTPRRRSMRAENSPPAAMPIVLALTAKLIAAGVTRYAAVRNGRMACAAERSGIEMNPVIAITMKESAWQRSCCRMPATILSFPAICWPADRWRWRIFRGDWCPFREMTLAALNDIWPDTGDNVASAWRDPRLCFAVLSNVDGATALRFGAMFRVPDALREFFEANGLDPAPRHGNPFCFLPIPAAFIVDRSGVIRDAYASGDITDRAEPDDILARVRLLAGRGLLGDRGLLAGRDTPV